MADEPAAGAYQVPLEVYDELDRATPEQRTEIVLRLIEEHPHGRLELLARQGKRANLAGIDLSRDALEARIELLPESPHWWNAGNQGIDLQGAQLQGANLRGAQLQGARMTSAQFQGARLWEAQLKGANLQYANLQEVRMGAGQLGVGPAKLQCVNLRGARLQDAQMGTAQLQRADLRKVQLQDVDLSSCALDHAFFADAWLDRTRMHWDQLGGEIGEELKANEKEQSAEKRACGYETATRAYRILKQNFDSLGDYDASSKAYRKERRMEKLEAYYRARATFGTRQWSGAITNGLKALGDQFVESLCDYGESFWRVVGWMTLLLFVLGPAIVAVLGGLYWTGDNLTIYNSLSSGWQRWWYGYFQYWLYALDAFTTASFARLEPVNDGVRLASGLVALSGIVLAGLLGFVAGNRIRRS